MEVLRKMELFHREQGATQSIVDAQYSVSFSKEHGLTQSVEVSCGGTCEADPAMLVYR